MKTIKTYECECGEDFYEDDGECVNCGKDVEPEKFVEVEIPEITTSGALIELTDEVKTPKVSREIESPTKTQKENEATTPNCGCECHQKFTYLSHGGCCFVLKPLPDYKHGTI